MLKKRHILVILIFFALFATKAQELDTLQSDSFLESVMEDFASTIEGDFDYTEFLEEYEYYLQNPMNINSPDYDVLRRVFALTDYQIYELKKHISMNGGYMATLYELATVNGFDNKTIYRILPFIKVEGVSNPYNLKLKNVLKYGRNQIFLRYQEVLEEQKGYSFASDSLLEANPNARYLGSPQKFYAKYNFNYQNRVRFGITAEKDAGEEFFKGTQKQGFDFYSAHLFLQDFGIVKSLAIGDYHLQFGQGLTLWSGMAYGKTSSITGIKKRAQGIRPYTSADENNFFRGIATTLKKKDWELSLFYSNNRIDATVDTLDAEESYIASLQETGFHRTPRELAYKNNLNLQLFGTHLSYKTEFSRLGFTFYQMEYDKDVQGRISPYNQFEFTGLQNSGFGLNYETYIRKHSFFGEVSMSSNGGIATLNGLVTQLDPFFSISLLHRYYSKDYQTKYSVGFGESSRNNNEQGLFFGTNMIFHSKLTLDAYVDLFSFKWLKFRVDAPSQGVDYNLQLNYTPARYSSIYLRYRHKGKSINITDDMHLNRVYANEKRNFRIHLQHKPYHNFTVKSRAEWSSYQVEGSDATNGFLVYQDAQYNFSKIPLNLSARIALFNTDSYDERIYAYESDVLYAFSIPAYYYKGTRAYLVMKYQIARNINFWFRIAQTWYADRHTVASGLDEVDGNRKTDIKAQLQIKF